mmetsp:Transcript_4806/g.14684  ORF Transcript_4806/g.14684 Transcript_4806/m.14684 type:complete len:242 (+) Transcript_4806:114-839(+)
MLHDARRASGPTASRRVAGVWAGHCLQGAGAPGGADQPGAVRARGQVVQSPCRGVAHPHGVSLVLRMRGLQAALRVAVLEGLDLPVHLLRNSAEPHRPSVVRSDVRPPLGSAGGAALLHQPLRVRRAVPASVRPSPSAARRPGRPGELPRPGHRRDLDHDSCVRHLLRRQLLLPAPPVGGAACGFHGDGWQRAGGGQGIASCNHLAGGDQVLPEGCAILRVFLARICVLAEHQGVCVDAAR